MDELLNLNWFSGDVTGPVQPVVEAIGAGASVIISVVGFLIVCSSILKNSTHGLYAVSPKFWDRVYDVKQEGIRSEAATGGGNNQISKFIGTFTSFFLSLLPNVKAMTDFEKTQMDAKHYFMKSIPMMCVAIFIGVFIYLGYPAQVAGKFSQFGTFTLDMVMDAMDPEAIAESIPTEMALLKYQTENASTDPDKVANKIAHAAMSALTTTARSKGDITREALQSCLDTLEPKLIDLANVDYVQYADSDAYKWTVESKVNMAGQRTFSRQNGEADADGVVIYNDGISCSDLPMGVTYDVSDWYLYWTITFTPKAQKATKSAKNATVTLASSNIQIDTTNKTVTFDFSSYAISGDAAITLSADRQVKSDNGCKFKSISGSQNVIVLKLASYDTSKYADEAAALADCKTFQFQKGPMYVVGGARCMVTQITKGGNGCSFSADGATFTFGDNPSNLSATSSDD